MVHNIKGDLLKSDCKLICHQVNCKYTMGSGIAKQIKTTFPKVYSEYKNNKAVMGDILNVDVSEIKEKFIVNMYAQNNYGIGKRQTDYEAFYQCLEKIYLLTCQKNEFSNVNIAFPYKIGCFRGGANWNIIKTMIEEVFIDREVYIYELSE